MKTNLMVSDVSAARLSWTLRRHPRVSMLNLKTPRQGLFTLDITSGNILPGWPLAINKSSLSPLDQNQNGPAVFQAVAAMSQRGVLNLSHGQDARSNNFRFFSLVL
jgi:hypothetical protein